MIRSSRAWRTTAVLGAAALTLAACGGEEDPATGTSESSSSEAPAGDGELVVGTLLPQTGSLAFLGPPEFAGVQLAVDDINAAGGVLGKDVRKIDGDSGDTTTDIASQTSDRLISGGVDAVVGAASSGVSLTVIDKITGAGVIHFSPANTSPAFTDYDDKGLYFRVAPSDVLQGRVLGNLLIEDGFLDVGVMALDDAYGNGLADAVESTVTEGGGSITDKIIYNPEAATFSAEVGQLKASNPEAIVVIGFEETKKILPELIAQGIGPDTVPLYLVDGNLADYSKDFQPGALAGTKGTLPGGPDAEGDDFNARLLEVDSKLTDFSYSKESYDTIVMLALGAIAADSDNAEAIAGKLVEISKDGEKCTTFVDCSALLEEGTDIDYDGVSGPVDFTDAGEPSAALIGVYEYGEDNTYTNIDYVEGEV